MSQMCFFNYKSNILHFGDFLTTHIFVNFSYLSDMLTDPQVALTVESHLSKYVELLERHRKENLSYRITEW